MTKLFKVQGVSNSLWNERLAPLDQDERKWSPAVSVSLWTAMSFSLPVYLFASGMTALGMSAGVLLGIILLGSLVVVLVAVGCGHAGERYGIPFAVLARLAFGVRGAVVPAALRALVGCGWLGIACWCGALAVCSLLKGVSQGALWGCFSLFLVMVAGLAGRPGRARVSVFAGAGLMLAVALCLWFAPHGTAVSSRSEGMVEPAIQSVSQAVAAVLSLWMPIALGGSDVTRHVRSQGARVRGVYGLPVGMLLFCGMAAAITQSLGGGLTHWNPVFAAGALQTRWLTAACQAAFVGSILLTAAKVCLSLGEQFAGLMPSKVTIATGRWLACLLAAVSLPWHWMERPEYYTGGWLTGCAGLLAPVAAVLLIEYFVMRRRWVNMDDLYQRDGLYEYAAGWNWRAFGALAAGWIAMVFVLTAPSSLGWRGGAVWIGTVVSTATYWVLRSGPPNVAQIPPTPLLIPLAGFESEGASG